MDYEKKYKESMAKMSTFLAKHDGFTISKDGEMYKELSEIFSELKESEDEITRKELIAFVAENTLSVDERHDRWTAWLEKQGEHANFRNKIQIGDKVTRNEDGVLVNLSQLNRVAKKQGEQKEINLVEILKHYPIETELYSPLYGKLWLAEINEKCGIITCYKHPLDEGCTRAILEQEDTVSFYSNGTTGLPDFNVSKDCMLFLYDIEKQCKQNPAETEKGAKRNEEGENPTAWSEEDEAALGNALWCCKQAASIAKDENDMGNAWYAENWLKSLKERVQPQQKQECSEEDEKKIQFLIHLIERNIPNHSFSFGDGCKNGAVTKQEAIDMLKSLRPQSTWKPSDEQRIEAIGMAINALQEEPVGEDLEAASKNYALNNTPWDDCKDEIQESFKAGAKWQKAKDESVTKDLGEYINELSKQFPEVSFAKLSRIAVRVAKWQEQRYKEALNIYLKSQWNKGK